MHHLNAERPAENKPRLRTIRIAVVVNAIAIVLLFVLLEGGLVLLLDHPPRSPLLAERLRAYYVAQDRRNIQYDPDCARYDEQVSYTLRPGVCAFTNREFSIEVRVNSAGLRDSEQALAAPEIIVLGDSHAMGWGVEHDETFARLVGQRSGRSVLNAAVSSFGTARELRMLERLDTQHLEWLVIQYSPNDRRENRTFASTGRLKIMPRSAYDKLVLENRERVRYFPGKHLLRLLPVLVKGGEGEGSARREREFVSEARNFLQTVQRSKPVPDGVRLIVFEIGRLGQSDPGFASALRTELENQAYSDLAERMTILDLSAELTPELYLVYDGHMAPAGHRVVAERICSVIGCRIGP